MSVLAPIALALQERAERERREREGAERERVAAEQAERERILAERERAVAERERLLAERAERKADLRETERFEREESGAEVLGNAEEPSAAVLGNVEEPAVSHASTLVAPSWAESTAPAPLPSPPLWRSVVEVVLPFLGALIAVVAAGFVIGTLRGCDLPWSEHAPSQDAHR